MNKLSELLVAVNDVVVQASSRHKTSNVEYIKTSETSRTSWSAAGERDYAEGQAEISRRNLESVVKLKYEIEESIDNPSVASEIFFRYKDVKSGVENEVYVVENIANIKGFNLVSKKSPFGVAILGSKKLFVVGGREYEKC